MSTYSTSLKLTLIGSGEQDGTWGGTTNNNLGTLLEAAIAGVQVIYMADADYTLTSYNGLPDEARNAVIVVAGSNSAPRNVIAPLVEKTYIIKNTSGQTITIKGASGTGVAIPTGQSSMVYCDATNFYTAISNVTNATNATTATQLASTNWTVLESGGYLYFRYGGANKMRLDSSGNLAVTGDITGFASI